MQTNRMNNLSQLKCLLSNETLEQFQAEAHEKEQAMYLKYKYEVAITANAMLNRLNEFSSDKTDISEFQLWEIQCLAEVANCLAKKHFKNNKKQRYYYEVKEKLLEYTLEQFPKNIQVSESLGLLELSIFSEEAGVSCFHSPKAPENKFDRDRYSSEINYFEWRWSGILRQPSAVQIWKYPRLRSLLAKATHPKVKLSKHSKARINKLLAKAKHLDEALSVQFENRAS